LMRRYPALTAGLAGFAGGVLAILTCHPII
jgi:hypothetical protein